MGRFADPYGDDNRLPEGIICTGYDANDGRRYYVDKIDGSRWVGEPYVDKNDGSRWVGEPYVEYGALHPLNDVTRPKPSKGTGKESSRSIQASVSPHMPRKEKSLSARKEKSLPPLVIPELDLGTAFSVTFY